MTSNSKLLLVFLASATLQCALAQTPTLERLKEALRLEQTSDLAGAQAIYQTLLKDPDWAAAAHLSLARVLRWQGQHVQAMSYYQAVLVHTQATAGMREEATLGLAQIDALELRLSAAQDRLNSIASTSRLANQVQELAARINSTHPTRLGGSYGSVQNKGSSTDASWQLQLTHQLDMRNTLSVSYSRNSLQQRAVQPNAALDFIKGQTVLAWRYQEPLGAAYAFEATTRQLSLGSSETSFRAQGSWPLHIGASANWRGSAGLQQIQTNIRTDANGFAALSTSLNKQWQLGGTVFAAETATGASYSWMLNTTWEQGPWLAQWFVSRTLDASPVGHTVVLRQRLTSGPTWRAELRHDRNGNTAILGLDIPWGRHNTSTSFQSSPFSTQWSVGFDYALPNGLEK
jgi:hypothetical protein